MSFLGKKIEIPEMIAVPVEAEDSASSLSAVSGMPPNRSRRGVVVGCIVIAVIAGVSIGIYALAGASLACQYLPRSGGGGGLRSLSLRLEAPPVMPALQAPPERLAIGPPAVPAIQALDEFFVSHPTRELQITVQLDRKTGVRSQIHVENWPDPIKSRYNRARDLERYIKNFVAMLDCANTVQFFSEDTTRLMRLFLEVPTGAEGRLCVPGSVKKYKCFVGTKAGMEMTDDEVSKKSNEIDQISLLVM